MQTKGINHLALVTPDMDSTVRFWHGVLGAELVGTIGTPEFRHYFFRIGDATVDLGPVLYFVLVFLVIGGTSNGVNLTDGLDGLAAGSCAIVLLAYTAIAFVTNEQQNLALLSACLGLYDPRT